MMTWQRDEEARMRVLNWLREREPTVPEVAAFMGRSHASALQLLKSFEAEGYAEPVPGSKYPQQWRRKTEDCLLEKVWR